MLEALDELAIRPHRIAGASIGAFYATGMTGKQIRERVEEFVISPQELLMEEVIN